MTFKWTELTSTEGVKPAAPFKTPGTGEEFKYFKFAPGPEFLLTVAHVTEATSDTKVKCIFFDPKTGTEISMAAVDVPLTGVDTWIDSPSTFPSKPSTIDVGAGKPNCVIVCITEEWMRDNVPKLAARFDSDPQLFKKHPAGQGGYKILTNAIKALYNALQNQGINPDTIPEFALLRPHLPLNFP